MNFKNISLNKKKTLEGSMLSFPNSDSGINEKYSMKLAFENIIHVPEQLIHKM